LFTCVYLDSVLSTRPSHVCSRSGTHLLSRVEVGRLKATLL
jgi:hypothetical protein